MSKDKNEKPQTEYDKQVDLCVTDMVVKSGGGLFLGLLTKQLFFKSYRWPIVMGIGIGIGAACARCQTKLNELTATGPPCVAPKQNLQTYAKC